MPKVRTSRRITSGLKARYLSSPISKQQSIQNKAKTINKTKRVDRSAEQRDSSPVINIVSDIAMSVSKHFDSHRNPSKAGPMKKYMRNKFEFLGIMTPERRNLTRQVIASSPILTAPQIQELVQAAWQKKEREYQYFGADCASRFIRTLIGSDLKTCRKSLVCVKTLITTKSWWDTVDHLASKVIGPMVQSYPVELGSVMDEWISDSNMWLRRTAILHQLSYKNRTDQEKLFRYCKLQCQEKEFFIQKAIGWALRQHFRENPKAVEDFINQNKNNLAKLSVKEALKHA